MGVRLVIDPNVEADLSDAYEVVYSHYRRALLRKIPYAVFYEAADDTVTVYAVFHTSRDSQKWKRRLP